MKIMMSGIDWKSAKIELREWVSFSPGTVSILIPKIIGVDGVGGCVMLSTCNRTELYITVEDGWTEQPCELLCRVADIPYEPLRHAFVTRTGHMAVDHLMEVACGLHSQVLGEDQIVTQVKTALALAHNSGSADAILQTLFRMAATAGKQAKSEVRLTSVPLSVARRGVEILEQSARGLRGRRAVVIGNGEMGRLAASLLVERGCSVTVTLRTYRHGETVVPRGCATIPYDDRMRAIENCEVLISATTSPHFTVTLEQAAALGKRPAYIMDLALPRDIDPRVGQLEGVSFFDMDSMGGDPEAVHNSVEMAAVRAIIAERTDEFYRWWNYKESLPLMEEIKEMAVRRALDTEEIRTLAQTQSGDDFDETERAVAGAVRRAVETILGGMREVVTPKVMVKCRDKMYGRIPAKSHRQPGVQGKSNAQSIHLRFPLFTDLAGKRAVIIGAGKIASRRIKVLTEFGARVTVIAPEAEERINGAEYIPRAYCHGDCRGAFLVVAAADDREVNHAAAVECTELGIPVSVADCAGECTFFFPAVCRAGSLVAGIVSDGTEHHLAARAAGDIRSLLDTLSKNYGV